MKAASVAKGDTNHENSKYVIREGRRNGRLFGNTLNYGPDIP